MPFNAYDEAFNRSTLATKGGLYCITIKDLQQRDIYKIGVADHFQRRFRQYRNHYSPFGNVFVICVMQMSTKLQEKERQLQEAFKKNFHKSWDSEARTEWIKNLSEEEILKRFQKTFPKNKLISNISEINQPKVRKGIASVDFTVIDYDARNKMLTVDPIGNNPFWEKGSEQKYLVYLKDLVGTKGYNKFVKTQRYRLARKDKT